MWIMWLVVVVLSMIRAFTLVYAYYSSTCLASSSYSIYIYFIAIGKK